MFVESVSLDSEKIDFPIQIATIRVDFHYMFYGLHVEFSNKCVLQSLNIAFITASSADPDEMQQTTKLLFCFGGGISCIQNVYCPFSD